MIYLVGGSGFIGTSVAGELESRGIPFKIVDIRRSTQFESKICDIRDLKSLSNAIDDDATILINLAAEHRDEGLSASDYFLTNVGGAANLITVAESVGCKRIIHFSSVAVVHSKGTPYGNSKKQAEQIFFDWESRAQNRVLNVIRPTVVFGKSNRGNIYNLVKFQLGYFGYTVGRGENIKSICCVENLTQFVVAVLEQGFQTTNSTYVDVPDMRVIDLIKLARRAVGRDPNRILLIPKGIALLAAYLLSVSRYLGFSFSVTPGRVSKYCEGSQHYPYFPEYVVDSSVDLETALCNYVSSEFKKSSSSWD